MCFWAVASVGTDVCKTRQMYIEFKSQKGRVLQTKLQIYISESISINTQWGPASFCWLKDMTLKKKKKGGVEFYNQDDNSMNEQTNLCKTKYWALKISLNPKLTLLIDGHGSSQNKIPWRQGSCICKQTS